MSRKRPHESDPYDFEMQLTNQIIVETEPITRLQNSILHVSKPLLTIAESFKDSPECKKYQYCALIIDAEGISSTVWNLISKLCNDVELATNVSDANTIDDLLYVLFKYDIQLDESEMKHLENFIQRILLLGNTVFKRMTCLESNQIYYPIVMKWVRYIYYAFGVNTNAKIKVFNKLPRSMLLDLLIKNLKRDDQIDLIRKTSN